MTYKYQKCPSCYELSIADEQSCLFCDNDLSAVNYHPWRRFFARSFDMAFIFILWALTIFLFFLAIEPSAETLDFISKNTAFFNHPMLNLPLSALIFISYETLFLAIFGNTPGKKLFRIKLIHTESNKPSLKTAFNRTFMMYLVGMGFLIPVVNLYALYLARKRLVLTGNTLWDTRSNFHVSFKGWSWRYLVWVYFLYSVVFLLFAAIMSG